MMDTLDAIRKRRSVRAYTGEPIPREDLETIIDAGRLAPTGHNTQPWEFIVITDPEMIAHFKVAAEWIDQSGAVIALVDRRRRSSGDEHAAGGNRAGVWIMLAGRPDPPARRHVQDAVERSRQQAITDAGFYRRAGSVAHQGEKSARGRAALGNLPRKVLRASRPHTAC